MNQPLSWRTILSVFEPFYTPDAKKSCPVIPEPEVVYVEVPRVEDVPGKVADVVNTTTAAVESSLATDPVLEKITPILEGISDKVKGETDNSAYQWTEESKNDRAVSIVVGSMICVMVVALLYKLALNMYRAFVDKQAAVQAKPATAEDKPSEELAEHPIRLQAGGEGHSEDVDPSGESSTTAANCRPAQQRRRGGARRGGGADSKNDILDMIKTLIEQQPTTTDTSGATFNNQEEPLDPTVGEKSSDDCVSIGGGGNGVAAGMIETAPPINEVAPPVLQSEEQSPIDREVGTDKGGVAGLGDSSRKGRVPTPRTREDTERIGDKSNVDVSSKVVRGEPQYDSRDIARDVARDVSRDVASDVAQVAVDIGQPLISAIDTRVNESAEDDEEVSRRPEVMDTGVSGVRIGRHVCDIDSAISGSEPSITQTEQLIKKIALELAVKEKIGGESGIVYGKMAVIFNDNLKLSELRSVANAADIVPAVNRETEALIIRESARNSAFSRFQRVDLNKTIRGEDDEELSVIEHDDDRVVDRECRPKQQTPCNNTPRCLNLSSGAISPILAHATNFKKCSLLNQVSIDKLSFVDPRHSNRQSIDWQNIMASPSNETKYIGVDENIKQLNVLKAKDNNEASPAYSISISVNSECSKEDHSSAKMQEPVSGEEQRDVTWTNELSCRESSSNLLNNNIPIEYSSGDRHAPGGDESSADKDTSYDKDADLNTVSVSISLEGCKDSQRLNSFNDRVQLLQIPISTRDSLVKSWMNKTQSQLSRLVVSCNEFCSRGGQGSCDGSCTVSCDGSFDSSYEESSIGSGKGSSKGSSIGVSKGSNSESSKGSHDGSVSGSCEHSCDSSCQVSCDRASSQSSLGSDKDGVASLSEGSEKHGAASADGSVSRTVSHGDSCRGSRTNSRSGSSSCSSGNVYRTESVSRPGSEAGGEGHDNVSHSSVSSVVVAGKGHEDRAHSGVSFGEERSEGHENISHSIGSNSGGRKSLSMISGELPRLPDSINDIRNLSIQHSNEKSILNFFSNLINTGKELSRSNTYNDSVSDISMDVSYMKKNLVTVDIENFSCECCGSTTGGTCDEDILNLSDISDIASDLHEQRHAHVGGEATPLVDDPSSAVEETGAVDKSATETGDRETETLLLPKDVEQVEERVERASEQESEVIVVESLAPDVNECVIACIASEVTQISPSEPITDDIVNDIVSLIINEVNLSDIDTSDITQRVPEVMNTEEVLHTTEVNTEEVVNTTEVNTEEVVHTTEVNTEVGVNTSEVNIVEEIVAAEDDAIIEDGVAGDVSVASLGSDVARSRSPSNEVNVEGHEDGGDIAMETVAITGVLKKGQSADKVGVLAGRRVTFNEEVTRIEVAYHINDPSVSDSLPYHQHRRAGDEVSLVSCSSSHSCACPSRYSTGSGSDVTTASSLTASSSGSTTSGSGQTTSATCSQSTDNHRCSCSSGCSLSSSAGIQSMDGTISVTSKDSNKSLSSTITSLASKDSTNSLSSEGATGKSLRNEVLHRVTYGGSLPARLVSGDMTANEIMDVVSLDHGDRG